MKKGNLMILVNDVWVNADGYFSELTFNRFQVKRRVFLYGAKWGKSSKLWHVYDAETGFRFPVRDAIPHTRAAALIACADYVEKTFPKGVKKAEFLSYFGRFQHRRPQEVQDGDNIFYVRDNQETPALVESVTSFFDTEIVELILLKNGFARVRIFSDEITGIVDRAAS